MTDARNDERCCGRNQKSWTGARCRGRLFYRDSFLACPRSAKEIFRLTFGFEMAVWERKKKERFWKTGNMRDTYRRRSSSLCLFQYGIGIIDSTDDAIDARPPLSFKFWVHADWPYWLLTIVQHIISK